MPRSVEGLIQARIDTLPTAHRRRLRAVSVLGKGFRVEHATATLDVDDVDVVRRELRALVEFLSIDRNGWAEFRHALIRDAAYEGLPFRRRQELHARVGDSILQASDDQPDEQAELLAVHYWHARRWEEASRFSRIAGDQAREIYANVEAARFYERAVAAMVRVETTTDEQTAAVWRSLGLAREATGDFDSSIAAFRAAGRLVDGPVAKGETHELRAEARVRAGAFRQALVDTALGLSLIEATDTPDASVLRAGLLAVRARIRLDQGRVREAVSLAESAVDEAEPVGALRALAHAYEVLEFGYQQLGQPGRAVYGAKTLQIYQSLGDLRAAAITEMNLGVTAYARGAWAEAIAHYTHALAELERLGDLAHAGFTGANLAEVLVSCGELDEAEAILGDARKALRASDARFPAVFADLQLARLELGRGEPAKAVEVCDAAIEEARALGFPDLVLEVSIYRAAAEVELGHAEEAIASLDDAYRAVNEDVAWLEAPLGRVRAGALVALGRLAEAEGVLSMCLEEARRQQQPYEEALVLLARADLARSRGEEPPAEEVQEAGRLLNLLSVIA